MSEVTRILNSLSADDPRGAQELLPLVYEQLRSVAAHKMAGERCDHTLQPTALVHEAYLRLTGDESRHWNDSRHFFAAAAEAMRRILVDRARARNRIKRGGGLQRVALEKITIASEEDDETLLFVHEALEEFARIDPQCTELIKLRFFAGISNREAARMLGMSERTAKRNWAYARAWLARNLRRLQSGDVPN